MSSRRIAATMLAILLVQVAVPLVPADATSGRSSPDFYISVMTLSSGGSVVGDSGCQRERAPS